MRRTLFLSYLLFTGSGVVVYAQPPAPLAPISEKDEPVHRQLQMLNQIPEDSLSERTDPGLGVLRALTELDAPDFLATRRLIARPDVRGSLNPTAKAVLAGILSDRWDSFSLAGNLWLAALKSSNADYRLKARQKLVAFLQPAHFPALIDLLAVPGPNVLAFEILQEVTGEPLDPGVKTWKGWWNKTHGKVDFVKHLLDGTQARLAEHRIKSFDPLKLWYLPDTIRDANAPYAKRSQDEQTAVTRWNEWANTEVKPFADDFTSIKPFLDRVVHRSDPRITVLLESLVNDPALGDYASVVLAWRRSTPSLPVIADAYKTTPTVGRALARGSLGDKAALEDLLWMIGEHRNPLSYGIMDQNVHYYAERLAPCGILPAELAFELLAHQAFGFRTAATRSDKKKALKAARRWLSQHKNALVLDNVHGYFVVPSKQK